MKRVLKAFILMTLLLFLLLGMAAPAAYAATAASVASANANPNGSATGWRRQGSEWYFIKPNGEPATGWLQLGTTLYYFQSSGVMTTGWFQEDSTTYYFHPHGAMATGTVTIGGVRHVFCSDGVWIEQVSNKNSNMREFAAEVLRLVNQEREQHGLSKLSGTNSMLNFASMIRVKEIMNDFSHTRPGDRCFSTAYTDLGGRFSHFGENLAVGLTTPASVFQAWMNSDTHRGTILNPNYEHLGISVVPDSDGRLYWAKLFLLG